MLVQPSKELKGSIYCTLENNVKIAFSNHLRTLALKTIFSSPTMVGPLVDPEYERMSNILFVNSA